MGSTRPHPGVLYSRCEKQGWRLMGLGTIQNDILRTTRPRNLHIRRNRRFDYHRHSTYCAAEVPNWNTISSAVITSRGGSKAAQEIASRRRGICYFPAAIVRASISISRAADLVLFNRTNNFEEIAKFRARGDVPRIKKDQFVQKTRVRCCCGSYANGGRT